MAGSDGTRVAEASDRRSSHVRNAWVGEEHRPCLPLLPRFRLDFPDQASEDDVLGSSLSESLVACDYDPWGCWRWAGGPARRDMSSKGQGPLQSRGLNVHATCEYTTSISTDRHGVVLGYGVRTDSPLHLVCIPLRQSQPLAFHSTCKQNAEEVYCCHSPSAMYSTRNRRNRFSRRPTPPFLLFREHKRSVPTLRHRRELNSRGVLLCAC